MPGTAVVTSCGEVRLILERQGTQLRSFGATEADFAALADAFRTGKLFPGLALLTVRNYPDEAQEALTRAGFVREMRDYVLEKHR